MEVIESILTRRSIRLYREQEIGEKELQLILKAGMSGPSCTNARDWAFIVVRDREKLVQMAQANGRPAEPLKKAALGILICGDMKKAFSKARDYWVIDGSIAAQNMILAAHGLGIGSVWLGTWPQMERVQRQAQLFALPEHIVPHSVIAFGYPDEEKKDDREIYDAGCVHYEKW